MNYLYGASVQGIQSFIFQTNKLRDIVGASELVEQICTTAFNEFAASGESIVRAAGNIKHIFADEDSCKNAVLNFPQKVMTMAPGIIISQAVVELQEGCNFGEKADELEKKLRAQRNKMARPTTLGLMAVSRSSTTGMPAVEYDKEEMLDAATQVKRKSQETVKLSAKAFGLNNLTHENIAYDVNELTGKNNWIAVVHVDGNGVGNIVQAVGKDKEKMKLFSQSLDKATSAAAVDAYNAISKNINSEKLPIRPIVLGGDDLTVICRADIAIDYVHAFLLAFEKQTAEHFKDLELDSALPGGLTACAGVAFVKASYPFHYAVDLAEKLCSRAKLAAKKIDVNLAPSCLMFHKVQDSFVESYEDIVSRELMPQTNISFEFGPYFNKENAGYMTIADLTSKMQLLSDTDKKGNAVKTHLRQWFNSLHSDVGLANQDMKRLIAIHPDLASKLKLTEYSNLDMDKNLKVPFYDMLSLLSLGITTKQ